MKKRVFTIHVVVTGTKKMTSPFQEGGVLLPSLTAMIKQLYCTLFYFSEKQIQKALKRTID